jgi:hypothetical protein
LSRTAALYRSHQGSGNCRHWHHFLVHCPAFYARVLLSSCAIGSTSSEMVPRLAPRVVPSTAPRIVRCCTLGGSKARHSGIFAVEDGALRSTSCSKGTSRRTWRRALPFSASAAIVMYGSVSNYSISRET